MDLNQQHTGLDQCAVRLYSQQISPLLVCRIFVPLSKDSKNERKTAISVAAKLNKLQLGASQAVWAISDCLCEIMCSKVRSNYFNIRLILSKPLNNHHV